MTTVGLIGLGAMGSGMAASLRRAGHTVHVFDVRREAAEAFAREGGVACASLAELGAACDVLVSVVVNAAQTEAVLFGHGDGAAGQDGEQGGGERQLLEGFHRYSGLKNHLRLRLKLTVISLATTSNLAHMPSPMA